MRVSNIGEATCSVARALGAMGDAWTLLILRELFLGQHRFEEFQAQTGMAPYLLSRRLTKLVTQGIITRQPYRQRPTRYEYRLTEKGRDLHAVVVSLANWGDRWEGQGAGPPLTLIHKACGHEIRPVLTCPDCGEKVRPHDLRAKIGPAMLAERSANRDRFRAKTRRKASPNPPATPEAPPR